MPFYAASGEIRRSTNLFDPRLALRNVAIAAGGGNDPLHRGLIQDWDIKYGTTVTYIDVELGQVDHAAHGSVVELQVRSLDTGRQFQVQRIPLDALNPGGEKILHAPFLVYATGCEKIQITARVVSRSATVSTLSRMIPFQCGE